MRPTSPHLQIYKVQINSLLSITHRISGVFLFAITLIGSLGFLSFAHSDQSWRCFIDFYHNLGGNFWLWVGLSFLHYHCINGLRHMVWDLGYGFKIHQVKFSSYIVMVLSIAMTTALYLWIYS